MCIVIQVNVPVNFVFRLLQLLALQMLSSAMFRCWKW